MAAMGQDPSDEEIFQMIADVDDDGSNEIDFGEFCKVVIVISFLQQQNSQSI